MKPSEKQTEQVDRFFKNKLEDHTIAPSENAWAKVEAGLSKKNKLWFMPTGTTVMWRVAAAVVLMGVLISVVYWSKQSTNGTEKVLAEKSTVKSQRSTAQSELKENQKSESEKQIPVGGGQKEIAKEKLTKEETVLAQQHTMNVKREEKNQSERVVVREDTNHGTMDTDHSIANTNHSVANTNHGVANTNHGVADTSYGEKTKVEATTSTEVASTQQKPIKLEFTLESLPSETSTAVVRVDKNHGASEEKESSLKKVLNLARDLKQGEGPVGNLKEKKNELFAHNFITGKEKNQ